MREAGAVSNQPCYLGGECNKQVLLTPTHSSPLSLSGAQQRLTLPPEATLRALFGAARGTLVELDARNCKAAEPDAWTAEARRQ